MTVDAARRAGLEQYEISNFARPGDECRHNLAYWHNDFYIAAGTGAHGHLPPRAAAVLGIATPVAPTTEAIRYWHTPSVSAFVETSGRGRLPVSGAEAVARADRTAESILVGLRLTGEGVELHDRGAQGEAAALHDAGLLRWDGRRARVTARGQELLDAVALRLVDACDGRSHAS
jgi:oxygen-independent coproporphyrinogen-3 oxidase